MASLVIAEHNGNTLLPSTLSTITAAKAINSDIDILMLGYGIESIAVKASHIQGISTVFVADSPLFEHLLAENVEKQISYFLNSGKNHYQSILFPASSFGKNCAPRLAAKLVYLRLVILRVSLINIPLNVQSMRVTLLPQYTVMMNIK